MTAVRFSHLKIQRNENINLFLVSQMLGYLQTVTIVEIENINPEYFCLQFSNSMRVARNIEIRCGAAVSSASLSVAVFLHLKLVVVK